MSQKNSELLIGAHTSAAGGVHNALIEGQSIGATTIQFFTSNQRQWKGRALTSEAIDLWNRALKETGMQKVMSHDSYLINLGAGDPEMLAKSRQAFEEEITRCNQLSVTFLNFHPGAYTTDTLQNCLDRIVESMLGYQHLFENSTLTLLLETTAGQGSAVGWKFEELAYILDRTKAFLPVGVCIDTCHIFAAGYDVRTPEAWDSTLKEFDRLIGLKYLNAFHINDSMKALGSRVDRHQQLGEGQIGIDCFEFLMRDFRTREIPKYLETPDPKQWTKEIEMLRNFAK